MISLLTVFRNGICLFYLILRGLDTVEDDMTLDLEVKCKILRDFHTYLSQRGWCFTGSGPNEKDRHLLVGFSVVRALRGCGCCSA
jgi:farnesyl-diphosphate farnesyltransferase